MRLSILPLRISAGSSLLTWLVVKTMILSLPHADHIPSMKLSSPERVTLLGLSSSSSVSFFAGSSFSSSSFSCFFSFLFPVRSSEQSMSSITMMDLPEVSISSFRNSELFYTVVNSRSYRS
ncbi:hypothetical protein MLD38_035249 [Melastoma candidum]|uniref:Uncharacterized protein n=1 Tax=Melastoma candidum TaxID=119954 RepID=A0ACB9MD47_9MYRT|nr:hypothetical protein MLD38_035249 [Melastoma candidum]